MSAWNPVRLVVSALVRWNTRLTMILRLWGRVRVHGRENMPQTGAVLVVSNHLGGGDPPLLHAVLGRRCHFLARSELFRIPLVGPVIRCCGALPVQRNSPDRTAVRRALELLAAGEVVVIYPEGERSADADLMPAKDGAGLLALRSGATILPIGMAGSERIVPIVPVTPRQRGIDIRIGAPFAVPQGMTDRRAVTDLIMERIGELLPEMYRGYLRDRDALDAADQATTSGDGPQCAPLQPRGDIHGRQQRLSRH